MCDIGRRRIWLSVRVAVNDPDYLKSPVFGITICSQVLDGINGIDTTRSRRISSGVKLLDPAISGVTAQKPAGFIWQPVVDVSHDFEVALIIEVKHER